MWNSFLKLPSSPIMIHPFSIHEQKRTGHFGFYLDPSMRSLISFTLSIKKLQLLYFLSYPKVCCDFDSLFCVVLQNRPLLLERDRGLSYIFFWKYLHANLGGKFHRSCIPVFLRNNWPMGNLGLQKIDIDVKSGLICCISFASQLKNIWCFCLKEAIKIEPKIATASLSIAF